MPVFPATESTLSAQQLGSFLQIRYALSPGCTCRLLRTGMNHLYTVTDGEAKFVFRVYTYQWRSDIEVQEEVRLLAHLRDSGVPVSYPISDSEGEYLQHFDAIEGKRLGVMFSFAPGKKIPHFSAGHAHSAGVAIGTMHKSTQNMALGRTEYDYDTMVVKSLDTVERFFGRDNDDVQFLRRVGEYARHTVFSKEALMRRGVVHLDVWFDNMHFTDDGQVMLFDFDFCGVGILALDVGYFLFQLFSTHQSIGGHEEKSKAFLEGYGEASELTPAELEHLPQLALSVLLYYIGVQCAKYDTWSNIFLNEDHLKRFSGAIKRWVSHHGIDLE